MFQPEVKYEFVKRYCSPTDGWTVFVDIDASEEGRTGGDRKDENARKRQAKMQADGERMRRMLNDLGVTVGGNRADWFERHELPRVYGDRDVVAFHRERRECVIAEVEGDSSGQPEQKLYKAIGQIVLAVSRAPLNAPWSRRFVVVVYGQQIGAHLRQADCLSQLSVSGLSLSHNIAGDELLFGDFHTLRTSQ